VRGDGWALAVEVDDGDVLLEGEVPLQEHLHAFVLAARGVPGVRSVRADASIRATPPAEDPYHP
jgi:osmotically-inducible protein OsmY